MTVFSAIQTAVAKRALYLQTIREIQRLPADYAIDALGFDPSNAKEIARRAVYG